MSRNGIVMSKYCFGINKMNTAIDVIIQITVVFYAVYYDFNDTKKE